MNTLMLNGSRLTVEDLVRVARDPAARIEPAADALERVARCRAVVDRVVARYAEDFERCRAGDSGATYPAQEYGVTTGFGEFKDVPIAREELDRLQRNILLSHASGVGATTDENDLSNYFPPEVVRAVLVLRVNAFLKGHSGVRPRLVRVLVDMLHAGVAPLAPLRGSLGSSGDLCPLAHLFCPLLGQGRFVLVQDRERTIHPGAHMAGLLDLPKPALSFKEGLALTNGATFSAALLALSVYDAEVAANTADVAVALTLEGISGCARAFDPQVHRARGMRGQADSAANVRNLVRESRSVESAGQVQDAYSVRCAPAVHGATRDAIAHARAVAQAEMNAATDNPLFFPAEDGGDHQAQPFDWEFAANWPGADTGATDADQGPPYDGRARVSYSAGNFHGQPIALAADFLAMAVAELANVSERRTQMLLDDHHSHNLPANLIAHPGVNSGFLIAQYCAASLVSENKMLCHPASVDSIPSSANTEDHVAMATVAARKLRLVIGNTQAALAIELMVASQAVEWRVAMGPGAGEHGPGTRMRPHRPWRKGHALPADLGRRIIAAHEEARVFRAATKPENRGDIAAALGRGTRAAYLAIRGVVPPLTEDRVLEGDVRRLRMLVESGELLDAVFSVAGVALRHIESPGCSEPARE